MEFGQYLGLTFAIFVTLAILSFLYKDNPFYRFAEHLVVGVSAGYFVIILWFQGLDDKLFGPLADGDWYFAYLNSSNAEYMIPAILGCLMWTRFSKNYSWVSRWPMAMYIGISAGLAIPLEMSNRVNKQLAAMMVDIKWDQFLGGADMLWLLDINSGLSQVLVLVGTMLAIIYFFFSKAHTGVFGKAATGGIWVLMIGFGASFGFTVMARISLFINRIQDTADWGKTAFDAAETANPNYHSGFQVVFWALVVFVIGYVVWEIMKTLKEPKATAQ